MPKLPKYVGRYISLESFIAILAIIGVTIVGYAIIRSSHAQGPYASSYAANGNLTGSAIRVAGGSNSNSQAVQFGSVTPTSTGGCANNGILAPCIGSATTAASGWSKPVFDDEFDQDSSLNTNVWGVLNGPTDNQTLMQSSNESLGSNGLSLLLASNQSGAGVSSGTWFGGQTGSGYTISPDGGGTQGTSGDVFVE